MSQCFKHCPLATIDRLSFTHNQFRRYASAPDMQDPQVTHWTGMCRSWLAAAAARSTSMWSTLDCKLVSGSGLTFVYLFLQANRRSQAFPAADSTCCLGLESQNFSGLELLGCRHEPATATFCPRASWRAVLSQLAKAGRSA